MAELIFKLRGVPDDEAEEVRALLMQHGVPFYETSAGNWGIGSAAIWLEGKDGAEQARQLIAQYQLQRVARARAEYEQLKAEGRLPTVWSRFCEDPIRVLIYLGVIALLLYLMLNPFLLFGIAR